MPLRIRVVTAAIFWAGAFISVFLIGAWILTFEIADSVGTSWIHRNSLVSLGAGLVVCLMELVLTAATDGRSRSGTINCSCLLTGLWALLFCCDTVGCWFVIVSAISMIWNVLLFWQADRARLS